MSQFLYFLPKATAPANAPGVRKLLDSVGLSHVHDGRAVTTRLSKGPGGADGLLCSFDLPPDSKDPHKVPLFKPDGQTWVPIGDAGVSLGMWNANPPGPDELRRKRFVRGIDVEMLDGKPWTVPVAVSMTGLGTLPKRMQLGPDGKSWLTVNLPEFLGLCKDAETVFGMLQKSLTDEKLTFEFDYGMEIVIKSIGVNYRVSGAELSLLGCVGDLTMAKVMRALCDFDAFVEALIEQAKNESASAPPDTDSGVEADSPAICPPSAT
jgi:hypothetical protein